MTEEQENWLLQEINLILVYRDRDLCLLHPKTGIPTLATRKPNWIDFSAGQLIEGRTMQELVPEFIDKILRVASGEPARNEENGYREISIFKNGVTL